MSYVTTFEKTNILMVSTFKTLLGKLSYSYCRVHFQTSDVVCGSGDRLSLAGFPLVHTSQAYYLHQVGEFTSGLRTSRIIRGWS